MTIIATKPSVCQQENWQLILAQAVNNPAELFNLLELDLTLLPAAYLAGEAFSLRVPRGFIARMEKGDLQDPLLRQVLPIGDELLAAPGYTHDPLQEQAANPVPGLLHKYQGRVLLTLAGACAVNCRYCFRRHFPYGANIASGKAWRAILDYITQDTSIHEVIFSGGDPLVVKDEALDKLILQLADINHVKRLRIHTRFPILIPERITPKLIHALTKTRLQAVMVLHVNHPNEIDENVKNAMFNLRDANITLLNQSVLLKNINDNAQILIQLSEKLFEIGVMPYYLHLPDKVQGTAHFNVSMEVAQQLTKMLMQKLPGYLVPKLVYEKPNVANKVMISV